MQSTRPRRQLVILIIVAAATAGVAWGVGHVAGAPSQPGAIVNVDPIEPVSLNGADPVSRTDSERFAEAGLSVPEPDLPGSTSGPKPTGDKAPPTSDYAGVDAEDMLDPVEVEQVEKAFGLHAPGSVADVDAGT